MKALFLITALWMPCLSAQEATVSMKIDLVAWGNSIGGLSLKTAKGKGETIALAFRYSTPVAYSGPAIMEIHRSGNGGLPKAPEPSAEDLEHESKPLLGEDEKPGSAAPEAPKRGIALELEKRRKEDPSLVALAALPPTGCRRATVLLAPAGGGTFTAYVIDDDPAALPTGKLRIHNLSPLEIAVRCNGKQRKKLKAGKSFVVPAPDGHVIYELAYKSGDVWKMQENNIIPVRKNEQTQMIFLKSRNGFFLSSDGSSGGFLQLVILRRSVAAP